METERETAITHLPTLKWKGLLAVSGLAALCYRHLEVEYRRLTRMTRMTPTTQTSADGFATNGAVRPEQAAFSFLLFLRWEVTAR
jgi:hypothetical protein